MYRLIVFFVVFLHLWLSASVRANPSSLIELTGLFGQRSALLKVDGKDKVLRLGSTWSGVTLLEIKDKQVLINADGQSRWLSLSSQTSVHYKPPSAIKAVRIASGKGGHYWVTGKVNGSSVKFVIDTGATTISMNASTAKRLGLDHKNGKPIQMSTANGIKDASLIKLKKVTIGQITRYGVLATIAFDDALPYVLLGNSFLNGVDWRKENGVLILESII
jgi:aspartyl protease family protein